MEDYFKYIKENKTYDIKHHNHFIKPKSEKIRINHGNNKISEVNVNNNLRKTITPNEQFKQDIKEIQS